MAKHVSVSLSSDEIFDRKCSLCEKEKKVREAVNYCEMCCEFLCTGCLAVHNKLPALRNHWKGLVGKEAMLKVPEKQPARDTLTTMCEDHGRLIDLFCHNHEKLCCSICQVESHISCVDVDYIPNIALFPDGHERDKALADMRQATTQLERAQKAYKAEQERINKERRNILGQIAVARRRLNGILDLKEQEAIQEANRRFVEWGDEVKESLEEYSDIKKAIDETAKSLEDTDKEKEAQMFVMIKKSNEQVKRCQQMQRKSSEAGQRKITFTVNLELEKHLTSQMYLGTFKDTKKPAIPPAPPVPQSLKNKRFDTKVGTAMNNTGRQETYNNNSIIWETGNNSNTGIQTSLIIQNGPPVRSRSNIRRARDYEWGTGKKNSPRCETSNNSNTGNQTSQITPHAPPVSSSLNTSGRDFDRWDTYKNSSIRLESGNNNNKGIQTSQFIPPVPSVPHSMSNSGTHDYKWGTYENITTTTTTGNQTSQFKPHATATSVPHSLGSSGTHDDRWDTYKNSSIRLESGNNNNKGIQTSQFIPPVPSVPHSLGNSGTHDYKWGAYEHNSTRWDADNNSNTENPTPQFKRPAPAVPPSSKESNVYNYDERHFDKKNTTTDRGVAWSGLGYLP